MFIRSLSSHIQQFSAPAKPALRASCVAASRASLTGMHSTLQPARQGAPVPRLTLRAAQATPARGLSNASNQDAIAKVQQDNKSLDFTRKPDFSVEGKPIDGRPLVARRLQAQDAAALHAFLQKRHRIGDSLSTPAIERARMDELFAAATMKDCDTLVAVLGDQIVGVAEYDRFPFDMEADVNQSFLKKSGHARGDV